MMTDYHTILVLSILRLLLASALLFTVLPALLFPPFPSKSMMERFFGIVLFMAGATIVMMHLFVLLKLNDNIAVLIISVWIIALKWWYLYRRQHVGFVLIKAVLLRWIEILARPTTVKRLGITLGDFWRREIVVRLAYFLVFALIIIGAVVLRIGPIWDHPAPLSTEYYETLDQVKHLQINEMYLGESRIPIGMPLLISALCTASQVNPTVAVHFFGMLSVILVCASIFYGVYSATRNRIEASLACAIFAVAYNLLPGSVNHQIEADSLTLALVFLIPSITFFIDYIIHGGRARLFASLSGIIAVMAINIFTGCVAIAAAAIILCVSFCILPSLPRLRARMLLWHGMWTALAAAAVVWLWWSMTHDPQAAGVLNIIFYDQHFYRYAATHPVGTSAFMTFAAGVFVVLIGASMFPSTKNQWHLHLIGWGAIGILLLVLSLPAAFGLEHVIPEAETLYLLAAAAAVAMGLCAGVLLDIVQVIAQASGGSNAVQQWIRTGVGACTLAAVAIAYRGQPATAGLTAEPDAFVRNLYAIERTFIPYQWTIVAHRGILLAGMNRGRFLDYDYFTAMYDPFTYRHGARGAIPTALVFIFIEKNKDVTGISSELFPLNRDAMAKTRAWCEEYRKTHTDMTVFFSDENIIIYELRDPHIPSLRV